MRISMTMASQFFGTLFVALFGGMMSHSPNLQQTIPVTLSLPAQCSALVFDLGGILFETNKSKTMWELGPTNLFSYWQNNGDVHQIRARFYATLNAISKTNGNPYGAKDDEGLEIPLIMAQWLRGERPNKEILDTVVSFIRKNDNFFSSSAEKKIIKNMALMMFTPERFVKTRAMIPGALELIQECKERGFKVFILSNWDPESSSLLIDTYFDLFSLCDGLIISGKVHAIKPEPAIFNQLVQYVPIEQCIYLDDQLENIESAQKLGIYSIHAFCDEKASAINKIQSALEGVNAHAYA